jgi:hypothetical protein
MIAPDVARGNTQQENQEKYDCLQRCPHGAPAPRLPVILAVGG